MTKVADDFLWAARECLDRGYDEVNLNAGCPSGTVVAKKKGAGMLEDTEYLERFLDAVFAATPLPISVKTRLGLTDPQEFVRILEIYNQYPIKEVTIHPRVRKQFYDGDVDMEMFRYAMENSKNPLCFNGNLRTLTEVRNFEKAFPQIEAVMIGRGLIGNPAMLESGGESKLEAFHDALLETYIVEFGGARNAMFRMKENWRHMIWMFEDNEKLWKKLRKCTDVKEYRSIVGEIFHTLPMHKELHADW
jgi:tRNA-dihydrouridine synthase